MLWTLIVLLQVSAGMAKKNPGCDMVCNEIYQPLCAVDPVGRWKTFGNECELQLANCRARAEAQ